MERQKKASKQGSQESENDHITVAEAARMYNVSIPTIHRKIRDGNIFKGAEKVKNPNRSPGEIWVIPRSEVESVSLKEIAPRLYQKGQVNKPGPHDKDTHNTTPTFSLEDRVSVLERYMIRLFDRLDVGAP